jgi:hypothetical protein
MKKIPDLNSDELYKKSQDRTQPSGEDRKKDDKIESTSLDEMLEVTDKKNQLKDEVMNERNDE